MKLSYNERNWLAGFVDGEGCISIIRQREKRKNKIYYRIMPQIIISNTDKAVINYILPFLKDKHYYIQHRNKNWKPCYNIKCSRNKAIHFLKIIYPYLKIKKRQAKLCFELVKTINTKRNKKIHKKTLIRRLQLFQECKKLNRRGIKIGETNEKNKIV